MSEFGLFVCGLNIIRMRLFIYLLLLVTFSAAAQEINVMTYNIRYDNPKDGVNQWGSRKQKIFDLIKKYRPDILGVQEALANQLKDITDNVSDYVYIGVGRDDGKEKGEYSAILYRKDRFDALEQNTFWLSETPELPGSKNWDAAITRVATWARMRDKKSNEQFLMINTHFDHMGKEARKKSAELLKAKALELANGLPVIITGDLNCTREEPPYQVMMAQSGLLLIDPAPKNPPGTFCNFGVNSMECRPIDYIFHTSLWESEHYSVIQDNDGQYYPSDHLPVFVRLKLKKK
jgi:endonuclease/exonuclease/phosphatase family metal-dependent hydrolase